jgi:hypothetical protein
MKKLLLLLFFGVQNDESGRHNQQGGQGERCVVDAALRKMKNKFGWRREKAWPAKRKK